MTFFDVHPLQQLLLQRLEDVPKNLAGADAPKCCIII